MPQSSPQHVSFCIKLTQSISHRAVAGLEAAVWCEIELLGVSFAELFKKEKIEIIFGFKIVYQLFNYVLSHASQTTGMQSGSQYQILREFVPQGTRWVQ